MNPFWAAMNMPLHPNTWNKNTVREEFLRMRSDGIPVTHLPICLGLEDLRLTIRNMMSIENKLSQERKELPMFPDPSNDPEWHEFINFRERQLRLKNPYV